MALKLLIKTAKHAEAQKVKIDRHHAGNRGYQHPVDKTHRRQSI